MSSVLLSVHVLAAILTVGPVAVAASMLPPSVRAGAGAVAATLHRICRTYAVVGVVVPAFGLATAAALHVLGDAWVLTSLVVTAGAGAVLALAVLPLQRRLLGEPGPDTDAVTRRLAALTGVFNLLWAAVVVLMIVRPGSTTRTP